MIIKQTFFNHFKALWGAISLTFIAILLWIFFRFNMDLLFILLGFYALTVVPSFFLHITYYFRNKGMRAEISADKIWLKQNGKEIVITSNEISEITVYKSASMDAGGMPVTAMEHYFFVRIYCTDKRKYEITCLMDLTIDHSIRQIKGVKIYREKGLFFAV